MIPVTEALTCERECGCAPPVGPMKLIVITGGPGAGKTAVLEIIRKELCRHIVILPEAASIIFGGGFWRLPSITARQASQRAILHIQQEMERLVIAEGKWTMGLCDRGILDGLAYWPGDTRDFWAAAGTSLEAEYARYHAVIHLRTPTDDFGYNHVNPLRTETAAQAAEIDARIHDIWAQHPHYRMVKSTQDFMLKVQEAMHYIMEDMPACCARSLQKEEI